MFQKPPFLGMSSNEDGDGDDDISTIGLLLGRLKSFSLSEILIYMSLYVTAS